MIYFHFEEIEPLKLEEKQLSEWIKKIVELHHQEIVTLNLIFCSDNYLLGINKQYLQHDYYTDIITFDNSDDSGLLEGDLYISIDRVKDNAGQLKISFDAELKRVVIHGILHLLGFNDKTDMQQKRMREKEEESLRLFNS